MRHVGLAGLSCCLLLMNAPTWAKEQKGTVDIESAMTFYAKLAAPAEPHNRMASRAGSWSTITKEWTDPQKPPTESAGACVSTWMDSMGTGIFHMEGKAGRDAKRITLTGRYDDPLQGPMKLRAVTKLVDRDHEVFEMYGAAKTGKETKMLEIVYTRKQ